jgi:Flp pilus assembly pilin Flp
MGLSLRSTSSLATERGEANDTDYESRTETKGLEGYARSGPHRIRFDGGLRRSGCRRDHAKRGYQHQHDLFADQFRNDQCFDSKLALTFCIKGGFKRALWTAHVTSEDHQPSMTLMRLPDLALVKLRIWRDRRGQDLIEYALMAGFVAVAVSAVMPGLAESIITIFSKIASGQSAVAVPNR